MREVEYISTSVREVLEYLCTSVLDDQSVREVLEYFSTSVREVLEYLSERGAAVPQ